MSACRPAATCCQPRSCTSVGFAKAARNQSRVGAEKRSIDVPTSTSLITFGTTNKCSLTPGTHRISEANLIDPQLYLDVLAAFPSGLVDGGHRPGVKPMVYSRREYRPL